MIEGERQVAPTLDGIRRDHVARYEWVANKLQAGSTVIDFACGVGYGTRILADAGHAPVGFDNSGEAIGYAREHYAVPVLERAAYGLKHANAPGELPKCDAAVCFETIEHLKDPRPLLLALREAAPLLFASVPNEDVFPWEQAPGLGTAFHYRHYTKAEFAELLHACGWQPIEWHGQAGPESEVEPNIAGRTLIAVCARCDLPEIAPEPPAKHICILGLGPSLDQYSDLVKRLGGRSKFCDEVWAINALGNVFDCDLVFHMDDVRIQRIRAAAAPESNIAAMLEWLKISRVPVVTSRAHPDYPALVEFPLEDVLNDLKYDYFNSTGAYAVAMAIHVGATKISLFGIDYTLPNQHQAEKGRACVEFWLGHAQERGIKVSVPKRSTLLDANCERASRLYGYDCVDVAFNMQEDGSVKLAFKDRETLPSAAQIEKNYDHSAPIAEQHQSTKEAPCSMTF